MRDNKGLKRITHENRKPHPDATSIVGRQHIHLPRANVGDRHRKIRL